LPRNYFLSPTTISHLRDHKKWSLDKFGHATTKKYFQDLDKGFQYIADNYERFPKRSELTGESGLSIYPVREHYIVYVPMKDDIHIADVLGQVQDIPNILNENAATFQRELVHYNPSPTKRGSKSDTH
jgi:plasmid stabilization system protein ParE